MHPTVIHRRAIALIAHYRARDFEAVSTLLDELTGPEDAGRVISSLVQVVNRVLDERPTDPDTWLQDALLHLAQAEDEGA